MGATTHVRGHALAAGALQSIMTVLYYALQEFLHPYGLPSPSDEDDRPPDLSLLLLCIQRQWDLIRASVAYPDELMSLVKQAHVCRNTVAHQVVMACDEVLSSLQGLVKLTECINASSDVQALIKKLVEDYHEAAGVPIAQRRVQTQPEATQPSTRRTLSSSSSAAAMEWCAVRHEEGEAKPEPTQSECVAKGHDCHRDGQFGDAVWWYTRALKVLPSNGTPLIHRAISHESNKDYAAAYADAQEVLRLVDNFPPSDKLTQFKVKYLCVAIRSLLPMGMMNQAQVMCARALALRSDDPVVQELNQRTQKEIESNEAAEAMSRSRAEQEQIAKQLEAIGDETDDLFDDIDAERDVLDLTIPSSKVNQKKAQDRIAEAEILLTEKRKDGCLVAPMATDIKRAITYLEEAGNEGFPDAWIRLANLYSGSECDVPADLVKRLEYLEKAANSPPYQRMSSDQIVAVSSVAEAEIELAKMLSKGNDQVKKDEQLAFYYFLRAAKHNHVRAQYEAAVAFTLGIGTPTDVSRGRKWMAYAAKRGDTDALMSYATMVHLGIGGTKSLKQAIGINQLARKMGIEEAVNNLKVLQQELRETKRSKNHTSRLYDVIPGQSALVSEHRARASKGSLTSRRYVVSYYLGRDASLSLVLGKTDRALASFRSIVTVCFALEMVPWSTKRLLLQAADEQIVVAPDDVNAAVVAAILGWWVRQESNYDMLTKAIELNTVRPESETKRNDMADLYFALLQLHWYNRQYPEALEAWTMSFQARKLPFRIDMKQNILISTNTPYEDLRRAFRAHLAVNPPDEVFVAGAYYGLAVFSLIHQRPATKDDLITEVLQPILLGRAADQLQPEGAYKLNEDLRDRANKIWRVYRLDSFTQSHLMSTCQFCQQSVRTLTLLQHQMGSISDNECPARERINNISGLDLDAMRPVWTHDLDK